MADFWKGIGGILKHPINEAKWMLDETKNVGKPLLKGDIGESWDQFKGTFGRHQDMMSDTITVPMIGENKLSKNSDAIAGAIIGGILAAPAMGAAGGTSAGGAGAGAGGGAGGGGLSGAGLGWQGGAQFGSMGPTFTPTTSFGGAQLGGGGTGAMGMSTSYTPTTAFGQGAGELLGSGAQGGGFDMMKLAQSMQNLQSTTQQNQVQAPSPSAGGRWGGFDSKLYKNPLLEKEYMRLYTEPTFKV